MQSDVRAVGGLRDSVVGITGGDGFIGSRVVACLEASGAGVRPFTGDLLGDASDLDGWLAGCTHVVHLAARSGGVGFQDGGGDLAVLHDNTVMTQRVLEGCVASGVRRVFLASSGVVYARDAGEVLDERAATISPGCEQPTGYAWSKLTDEAIGGWYAADRGLETVVGRFTNVYGPGGPFARPGETVVHALIRKCLEAAPDGEIEVWGDGSAVRNFVHVDDAARAVCTILASAAPGSVHNVAATEGVAIGELARLVVEVVAPGVSVRFDPTKPTGPARRVLDARRLEALGWEPAVALREGIAHTARARAASHPA